jgi:hypothetical protein
MGSRGLRAIVARFGGVVLGVTSGGARRRVEVSMTVPKCREVQVMPRLSAPGGPEIP